MCLVGRSTLLTSLPCLCVRVCVCVSVCVSVLTCSCLTLRVHFKVRLLLLHDAVRLQSRPGRRDLARVSRLSLDADDERTLGDLLPGELDVDRVLTLDGGRVRARVGHVTVLVVHHLGLLHPQGQH